MPCRALAFSTNVRCVGRSNVLVRFAHERLHPTHLLHPTPCMYVCMTCRRLHHGLHTAVEQASSCCETDAGFIHTILWIHSRGRCRCQWLRLREIEIMRYLWIMSSVAELRTRTTVRMSARCTTTRQGGSTQCVTWSACNKWRDMSHGVSVLSVSPGRMLPKARSLSARHQFHSVFPSKSALFHGSPLQGSDAAVPWQR